MTREARRRFCREFRQLDSYEREEILALLEEFHKIHREMETGRRCE